MRKIFLLFIIPIFLYSNELKQKHILLLNSYNQSMTWVQNITKSVYDTLEPSKNNIIIHIENMDTKRIYNKKYLEQLKSIYINKYKDVKFDLILSSDNNAFDFLRENRDEIFGNTPVSFSGVNFFKDSDLDGYKNYTGIIEAFDALKTVNIALKLRPNTKEIFVINDYLKTGLAYTKTIKEQLLGLNKKVKITFSDNISISELKKQISSLPPDTIVLLGVFFKDSEGTYFTYEKIGEILSSNSKVPVFCLLEFNLNRGVVGGNVIGGYYQGEAMSKIAIKILKGTPVSEFKVQKTGGTKYVFDYNELVKHDMNMSLLPKDTIILNSPTNFFKKHKNVILTSLIIISILIISIIILLVNIKHRKKLERILKDEKKHLIEAKEEINKQLEFQQILIDSVDAPIYYKNTDLIFIGCNKAFETFFGKEKKYIIGKTVYDFFPKETADKFTKKENELFVSLKTQTYEDTVVLPNKKVVNLQFYKNVYYDKNKNVSGFVGTFFDITQLKKITDELNESNKNLELKIYERTKELSEKKIILEKLFNETNDGHALLKNGKFIDCNNSIVSMFNCENKEAFLKLTPHETSPLLQPDGQSSEEKANDMIKECFDKGTNSFEWVHEKSTGENFWVSISLTKINVNNEDIIHVVLRDINEKKALESAIKRKYDELEESNEELHSTIENLKNTQKQLIESEKMANLGELVSGVAHEINTPIGVSLTGITHLLDITNDVQNSYQSDNMTKEKFEEYLKVSHEVSSSINLNLNRTAQLIKSFKQVAVDRESEIKRKFNLKHYLDEILLSINSLIKKSNINLNVSCDDIIINSYPGAYSQIITNLITNSVRHAYKTNEYGNISISVLKEENNIVLTYKDDGYGIPKENLNKIFIPFFTTNREKGGTGLGLSIIYNIITKNLGGRITCTSEESIGTTFKIVIPFN